MALNGNYTIEMKDLAYKIRLIQKGNIVLRNRYLDNEVKIVALKSKLEGLKQDLLLNEFKPEVD